MHINIQYDASTNGAPAGFFTAVNAAVQYWEQEITNPLTVTINFGWGEVGGSPLPSGALGASSLAGQHFSYAQVEQALSSAATSPFDVQAVTSLPLADPTGGAGFFVTLAEAAVLGLWSGSAAAGSIGLSSSDSFSFDPNNRAVAGEYDAIGVLEHEISEVLGRIADSGSVENGVAQYEPLDLFRYAAAGQLALTPQAASFSVDGQTMLMPFNAPSQGDAGDWSQSVFGDSFGEGATNEAEVVSPTDLAVMDVLGYSIAATPGSNGRFENGNFALSGMTSWAYDNVRGLFYFSTTHGLIESFDPATGKAALVVNLDKFVQGLAVSPDGSTLYVGLQGSTENPTGGVTETMDLVNLATRAVTAETYTGNIQEAGPASMVIAPDGTGYFTSSFGGSGWIPLRTFSTAQAFAPTIVSGAGMIGAGGDGGRAHDFAPQVVLSPDGRYALAYDTEDTDGNLVLLNARTGAVLANKDVAFGQDNKNADVSGSAGLIVDVTFGNIYVVDTQLSLVKDLSSLQPFGSPSTIIGAHFSQDGSKLYLWDRPAQDLLVYDTSTWQQVGTIALTASIPGIIGGGDPTGAMTLADNGRLLVLDAGTGFEIVDLRPGEHRYDFAGDGLGHVLMQNAAGVVAVGAVSEGAASFAPVGGLGPEWKFEGVGDLLGDGRNDFLIKNDAGAVLAGEVVAGQAAYTLLTGLGPEWTFRGVGDFLGEGHDQFLIENGAGAIVVGDHANGQTAFTLVSALGPEWSFRGAGDFLGDGKSDFLVENSAGALVVGEAANGAAQLSLVGALGPEWRFVGSGDFLGDGKDDFLIENSAGAIVAGEVVAGQMSLTLLTALGPEWSFRGAGDYLGEGHDQFLIENSGGVLAIGDFTGGAMHLTPVSSLGPEWAFH